MSPSGYTGATSTASTSAVATGECRINGTSSEPSSDDHAGKVGLSATGRQTYPVGHLIIASLSLVPTSIRATLVDLSRCRAMKEGYNALIPNNSWDLLPCPVSSSVITGKWIFKHKFNSDGTLEWYKARWDLGGFTK
jgi:hypothetical protein